MTGTAGPSTHGDTDTELVQVEISGMATGGEGVGRLPDGRAVFVWGALPGERVAVTVTEAKKRYARAALVDVVEASPARRTPPCPLVAAGCGGCGWQHVEPATQRELKAGVVLDALRRLGKIEAPPALEWGPDLGEGLADGRDLGGRDLGGRGLDGRGLGLARTTVRAALDPDGRPAFRFHHAHDLVGLAEEGCRVAHPLVDEVLRTGVFPPPTTEVTVRASLATGARLVIADPAVPKDLEVPEGVTVVGAKELAAGQRAWLFEDAAGRRWRVSAESFFQPSPGGAEALVEVVGRVLAQDLDAQKSSRTAMVDLYGGVGLFAGALAERTNGRIELVEANRSAAADARVNLADIPDAKVVTADVRRWRPSSAGIVVADPSRHGLGKEAVDRIGATGASALALVSCDAGALGRDAGLLAAGGWRLDSVVLVDLFPQTPHVEVVTGWHRG